MNKEKKIVLKDIAKEANVSIATVSRYLNGAMIRKSSIKNIENALKKNNWNTKVKHNKALKVKSIGVILPDITHNYFSKIADGIMKKAKQYDYIIVLASSERDSNIEKEQLERLSRADLAGLIYIPIASREGALFEELNYFDDIPLVVAVRRGVIPNRPHIYADNITGGYIATRYMLSLGRKKIGFIMGFWECPFHLDNILDIVKNSNISGGFPSLDRFKGYLKALNEFNIEYDPSCVIVSNWGFEGGKNAAAELILASPTIDAIITTSDTMAAGVLDTFKHHGINVPQDISIMGWDNSQLTNFTTPNLTTIEQPSKNIGMSALETVHKMILGKEVKDIVYNVNIIPKHSTSIKK